MVLRLQGEQRTCLTTLCAPSESETLANLTLIGARQTLAFTSVSMMKNRFLNILHLSDFHHATSSGSSEDVVVTALVEDLRSLRHTELAPDVCLFTGDLLYAADDCAYSDFHEMVFSRVAEATGLTKDRMFVCPGNHDVHRGVAERQRSFVEGLRTSPDAVDAMSKAYESGDLARYADEAFKNYLEYENRLDNASTIKRSSLISLYEIPELDLRLAGINTATLSFGGLKGFPRDERQLLIPEAFLLNGPESLSRFRPDIVFGHHPPASLNPALESRFRGERLGQAHLHAFGHMHAPKPATAFEDDSARMTNQSGALFYKSHKEKDYKGYAVVVLDREDRIYKVHHRSYYNDRVKFDLALQHYDHGTYYSSPGARQHFLTHTPRFNRQKLLDWSAGDGLQAVSEKLEAHLKRLSFFGEPITPNFELEGQVTSLTAEVGATQRREVNSLDELAALPDHVLIQGQTESGKSTALLIWAKLRSTCPGPYDRVPAYVHWGDLPKGPKAFSRLVNRSIALPDGFSATDLLRRGALEVLIDDFVVTSESVECLQAAVTEFPMTRFVVAYKTKAISELGFASFVPAEIPFLSTRIIQLKRGQIRAIVKTKANLPKSDEDTLIREIMRELVSNNLPLTAFTISSVMEIYGTEGALKFTNKANFLERLVEIKLEKFSEGDIKVGAFDFSNKVRCLADVSYWMVTNDKYVISENEAFQIVKDHMDAHGFEVKVRDLLDHFYRSSILTESNGQVRFGFMCFLEFFISKKMLNNRSFRDYIVHKERYLEYQNEISLYFAQSREDASLLDEIAVRIGEIRDHLASKQIFARDAGFSLDKVVVTRGGASQEELADYEHTVLSPQLSDEDRDHLLDGETPKDIGGRQEVYRPKLDTPESQWLYALILYSSMVRSCDYLLKSDKERHLNNALECWLEFLQFSLNIIPTLAEKGYVKIDEVEYKIPGLMNLEMPDRYRALQVMMPMGVSRMISNYMNTDKLRAQIKSGDRGSESGFMSFLRLSMLMDLSYAGLPEDMKPLFENIKGKSTYAEYVAIRNAAETYTYNRLVEADRKEFVSVVSTAIARLKAKTASGIKTEASKVTARLERNRLQIVAKEKGGQ